MMNKIIINDKLSFKICNTNSYAHFKLETTCSTLQINFFF